MKCINKIYKKFSVLAVLFSIFMNYAVVYGAQIEEYTGAFSIVDQEEYMNDPNLTLASVQCGFAPFISYPGKTIHLHFHELNTDTYYIFSTDKFQDGDVTVTLPVGIYQLSGSTYDNDMPSTDYPVYMYPEQFTLLADGAVTEEDEPLDQLFIEIAHEKNSITKTNAYQSIWVYPEFDGWLTYHLSGQSDNHEPIRCDYDVSTKDCDSFAFYVKDILTGTYEITDIHAYDRDGNEVNVYYLAQKSIKLPGSKEFEYNKMEFYIYRDMSDLPEGFLRLLEEQPEAWKTTQLEFEISSSVPSTEENKNNEGNSIQDTKSDVGYEDNKAKQTDANSYSDNKNIRYVFAGIIILVIIVFLTVLIRQRRHYD